MSKPVTNRPIILLFITILLASCKTKGEKSTINFSKLTDNEKRLPKNAMASMEVAEGLKMNLFASEPMIANPTNMAIDANGRVWICEGRNYRLFANPDNPYDKKGDRILILEDTDHDGVADTYKVFYQGEDINAALGIVVLGNKVIVSVSPDVFVFTDSNGDDVPDSKEIMYEGIDGVDHDHGAHAFVFGPDGRLYFNYGNRGHHLMDEDGDTIVDVHGEKVTNSRNPFQEGMAFRAEMDGSHVEVLGNNFRNPYELAIDSYGGLWQSDNDDDGNRGTRINFLMEYGNYGYKDQVTGANWRERRVGWSDSIPLRHWHLNDPGVVPNLLQTGSGSPTGMIVYEGDLLPDRYKNQLIHAEPGHNVVRSYIVGNDGAGYKARIENIVTSQDDWFRPDDVTVAPDGSLFISDWYDGGVGGHKAEDIVRGRIYHISTKEGYTPTKFDFSSGEGAAKGLLSDNMDVFYQSWQKLHALGEAAEPILARLIAKGGTAKARALWLGAKIPAMVTIYIDKSLADKDPKIRMQGIRMARYVAADKLTDYVAQVVDDSSAQVRREAAIALKYVGTPVAAELWADLAIQHRAGDRWELEALGIGADQFPDLYFEAWKSKVGDNWNTPAGSEIVWRVNAAATVPLLVDLIEDKSVSPEKLPSYFRAFHFKQSPRKNQRLLSLLTADHPQQHLIQAYAVGQLDESFVNSSSHNIRAVKKVLPGIEGTPEWLTAVKNLKIKGQDKQLFTLVASNADLALRKEAATLLFDTGGGKVVSDYFKSEAPEDSKLQVIEVLGGVNDKNAIDFLKRSLEADKFSYPLMRKVVESLGNTGDGQQILFDLLKSGKLKEVYTTSAVLKLMTSWDVKIRTEAPKYLISEENDDTDIAALEKIDGDPNAGKAVFTTYCATCHVVDGNGTDFGPGLSDIGSKLSRSFMYSSIVYPSAGINFGYEGYNVKLKDGDVLMGYILGKTEDEITLKMMGATTKAIPRKDIQSLEAMDKSLMPEGLDKVMKQQQLVDLVAYLETLKVKS
ncbi:PQQ-dependent sugar dehydrogenase [Flavobacteriaceae bacterium F89]|uniref:PQQ-dependent sugar dehydrogenase n=1 Tax=Cerina litoralis TaxID=2874477 RepID=A0AAE3EVF3_9FLAO|nr:PVC-type heme-binding CxxCH protein [Cerina litoralis]MCG2461245.1 PQQ-dependent sugar dehydrogenase [Cerina litoralis]